MITKGDLLAYSGGLFQFRRTSIFIAIPCMQHLGLGSGNLFGSYKPTARYFHAKSSCLILRL